MSVFKLFACLLCIALPKARRAVRHIATANAERRGARLQLENENPARAKPVEGGKPGLSGLVCCFCVLLPWPTDVVLRRSALAAREGGFAARSRTALHFAPRVASKKIGL